MPAAAWPPEGSEAPAAEEDSKDYWSLLWPDPGHGMNQMSPIVCIGGVSVACLDTRYPAPPHLREMQSEYIAPWDSQYSIGCGSSISFYLNRRKQMVRSLSV